MDRARLAAGGRNAPIVLRPARPRWEAWLVGGATVLILAMVVFTVSHGTPWSLLPLIPSVVLLIRWMGGRPRIELHDDVLVVRSLRTFRIPYADITSVHGDIPSRLDWSFHLVVERRSGKPVNLPVVDRTLPEVHDLIAGRAG